MKLKLAKALILLSFCVGFSNCLPSVRGNATTFFGGEPIGVYTFSSPTKLTTFPADGNLGDRVAMSCVYQSDLYTYSVAFGDASIASIAQRSGISRIRYVNTKTKTSVGQSTMHFFNSYPIFLSGLTGLLPFHRNTEHCISIYGDSEEVAQGKSDEVETRKTPEKVKR
jgi:hypothetical protein